jgi:hypothetical protein
MVDRAMCRRSVRCRPSDRTAGSTAVVVLLMRVVGDQRRLSQNRRRNLRRNLHHCRAKADVTGRVTEDETDLDKGDRSSSARKVHVQMVLVLMVHVLMGFVLVGRVLMGPALMAPVLMVSRHAASRHHNLYHSRRRR